MEIIHLSRKDIEKYLSSTKARERVLVAKCYEATEEQLLQLSRDSSKLVAKTVASRPDVTQEMLVNIVRNHYTKPWKEISFDAICSEKLDEMAHSDTDHLVLEFIASHKNTKIETLNFLAKNECPYVRAAVAENPNASKELIEILMRDSSDEVRAGIVKNSNVTEEILRNLPLTYWTCFALCHCPKTPEDIAIQLATCNNESIRIHSSCCKNLPREYLAQLIADPRISGDVRRIMSIF